MQIRESLADIFQGDEWPELLDLEQNENKFAFKIAICADLKWLKGHFPNQPVLPGVVQTHWACCLASQAFCLQSAIKRIDNLKFQSVVLPPQIVHLALVHDAAKAHVTFCYSDAASAQIFSEGKLIF